MGRGAHQVQNARRHHRGTRVKEWFLLSFRLLTRVGGVKIKLVRRVDVTVNVLQVTCAPIMKTNQKVNVSNKNLVEARTVEIPASRAELFAGFVMSAVTKQTRLASYQNAMTQIPTASRKINLSVHVLRNCIFSICIEKILLINEEALENFIRSIRCIVNNRDSSNCYYFESK